MANKTDETGTEAGGNLVQRAQAFATHAHKRIDHRRKYTQAPYTDHLAATAKLVKGVTDDPATLAAAWLHDTVEDTPATVQDIESEFGKRIAGRSPGTSCTGLSSAGCDPQSV